MKYMNSLGFYDHLPVEDELSLLCLKSHHVSHIRSDKGWSELNLILYMFLLKDYCHYNPVLALEVSFEILVDFIKTSGFLLILLSKILSK